VACATGPTMIYALDRTYCITGTPSHTLETDGYYARITIGHAGKEPPDGMTANIAKWLAMPLKAIDADSLQAFCRPAKCLLCKGKRAWECRQCDGTGVEGRNCDRCDLPHDCMCSHLDCIKGIIRCDCTAIRPALVLGELYDLWRVGDALEALGRPPEAGGISDDSVLVLKAGDVYTVVMRLHERERENAQGSWG
jgi:hypothetical protein